MSKRNRRGWRVIKTLTVDEARAIRVRELRGAAETHAEMGAHEHARKCAERADALAKR
jgi:hypothetical protein